jgi:hypothetical protein
MSWFACRLHGPPAEGVACGQATAREPPPGPAQYARRPSQCRSWPPDTRGTGGSRPRGPTLHPAPVDDAGRGRMTEGFAGRRAGAAATGT